MSTHDVDRSTPHSLDLTATRRVVLSQAGRLIAGGAVAAAVVRMGGRRTLAHSATPVPGADEFRTLTLTLTDDGMTASVESINAGYVHLTVVNDSSEMNSAALLTFPGKSRSEIEDAAATPVPDDGYPEIFFTAKIVGGPGDILPGETGEATVLVEAGTWVAFAEGDQAPVFLDAQDGVVGPGPEPESVLTVDEVDFAFGGLDAPISAGKQVWKVVNGSEQPHMLVLWHLPDGTTLDDLMAALQVPDDATPVPGAMTFDDIRQAGGVLLQSPGTTVWPTLDLPAGRYVAVCFVPDPDHDYIDHASEGMVALFDVMP